MISLYKSLYKSLKMVGYSRLRQGLGLGVLDLGFKLGFN